MNGSIKGRAPLLELRSVGGTKCFGLNGYAWNLVKRNAETQQFEPVDKMDRSLSSTELDAQYGIWVDEGVDEGHLWWKSRVGQNDGQVQPGEVLSFPEFRKQQLSYFALSQCYSLEGAEVNVVDGQPLRLETNWLLSRDTNYWSGGNSPLAPPWNITVPLPPK
ncbi:MAG: hypothetical protein U0931_11765 [Vulcanimicrobiota bacterium]